MPEDCRTPGLSAIKMGWRKVCWHSQSLQAGPLLSSWNSIPCFQDKSSLCLGILG